MPSINVRVKGIVQGVGFRPFIYQLAHLHQLSGSVQNNSSGVFIHLEGAMQNIECFLGDLTTKAPPLSKIDTVHTEPAKTEGCMGFRILKSSLNEGQITLLSPDIAVCQDCLSDIHNTAAVKRFKYAFTNCTNCGPRFSIIKALPYDRPSTTMKDFPMCPECHKEYENPLDRRFHAQPTCCSLCGPQLTLMDAHGNTIPTEDPIYQVRLFLKAGCIVAAKGLGGFHLLCDGMSDETILSLRRRKKRPSKPLALMMKDLGTVLQYCCLDEKEKEILLGNKKPILLLKKRNHTLPHSISFDYPDLGVMLPYTPLHHMLFDETLSVLVATSANHSGLPMLYKNEDALLELKDVADYFLVHNRDIHIPVDDSVVKVMLGEERVIRNARGYAPVSFDLNLSHSSSPLNKEQTRKNDALSNNQETRTENSNSLSAENEMLALGSEFKNTFCISKENLCFMSQYIGDLANAETLSHFTYNVNHFKTLYNINPKVIAYDYHPSFSYQDEVKDDSAEKVGVYHHHAHLAACLAENKIDNEVIGIAFDGIGYGNDGTLWGSEFLICDTKHFKRAAHLNYFKMPGGDKAALWPWRMGISLLYETFGEETFRLLPSHLIQKDSSFILSMLKNNTMSPLCCSMGRLFDAVAALLGFTHQISYEAEAAIYLENLAHASPLHNDTYSFIINKTTNVWVIDYRCLIREIVFDLNLGILHTIISRKFHNTMSAATLEICQGLRKEYHINHVALSGGVFQNEILFSRLCHLLVQNGFIVFTHKLVPCNDSGLSFGQLVVASRQIRE